MIKKILIGIGALVLIIIIGLFVLNYRSRSISPPEKAQYERGDFSIEVSYSRPGMRGRQIFGTKESGALLPFGIYWRMGANEATEITFSKDVFFNGSDLAAGTYRMYAVPGEREFEISLNTGLGKWGYSEPDYSLDILKTKIPVQNSTSSSEQFTIRFEEDGVLVMIICEWSDVIVKIPVEPK
jgi:hypothetical protein